MRRRTLKDAFIILEESQNSTIEQIKMLLTCIGFNSKAVITGAVTQIDLPRNKKSELRYAVEVLAEVEEISSNFFHTEDVVRHPGGRVSSMSIKPGKPLTRKAKTSWPPTSKNATPWARVTA